MKIDQIVLYKIVYQANLELEGEKEEGKEYLENVSLSSLFAAKKGNNSLNAAIISFNQCWSQFVYVDHKNKIRYAITGVHVVEAGEHKLDPDNDIYIGPSLSAQLPDSIEELMSTWKSTNPEKNRNAHPKER